MGNLLRQINLGVILFILLIGTSCNNAASVPFPYIENGVVDLTNWNFDTDGVIELNGEWSFFWHTFLYDTLINKTSRVDSVFVNVPGLWNNKTIDGLKIPGHGFASYRLKLKLKTKKELAIKYLNSATACEIYVNGACLLSSGIPGKTKETTNPGYKPGVITFVPNSDVTEIVIQLANFHHRKGGQWTKLYLGEKEQIFQLRDRQIFIQLFLIGSILIMAIFHLVIYFSHRYDKPLFYFGIFALLVAIKFLVSGEHTIYLFFEPQWSNIVRADYLSFYLTVLFFLFFMKSMFNEEINPYVSKIIIFTSLAFSASIVLPINYFSFGMVYFQVFTILGGCYAFYVLYLAIKRKRESANYFLFGFLLLFVCVIHDVLNENEMIHSKSVVPYGITLFIFVKALMLSSQIRNALLSNIKLSEELKMQNDNYVFLNQKYKTQNDKLKIAKEKAEESDKFKSAFLANISHEIRSPMNGILGFTELIRKKDLSEEKKMFYIDILEERGHHLLGVINDIIDVSKIETGLINLHNDKVDVNELFEQLYSTYNNLAIKKELRLIQRNNLKIDESTILADRQKLRQIFDNLIGNALKFTQTGEIEFGCLVKGEHLQFYVRDTGIGISPDEILIIFNRFNQANNTISSRYGGTGLGLSIVKAYVEKMGGNVWVNSILGQGSTFNFILPFYPKPAPKVIAVHQAEIQLPKPGLFVLLIEDDLTNAFLIKEILLDSKATVLHVKDGKAALAAFKKHIDIDIILMDIKLPDISGYELTRKMKALRPQVTIIAQTAFALEGDREKAIEAGCIDHIAKPINSSELISKIDLYTRNFN